eukprot:TRINITY_DN11920_c0_g7_i1.p1 TRINITY_DN11920_c0_g7~~TRINITY_DN11920_c0_g7_i1.p1  ORF type:complete len:227 (+),score=42.88 TRINITY_DN11920_c0_g7_i1:34-714(+)
MSAKRGKKTTSSPSKKAKTSEQLLSPSQLWASGDSAAWQQALDSYSSCIQARYDGFSKGRKKVPLPSHDQWLWHDLPKEVEKQKGSLIHKQLVKIMEWKLSRGKSRPLLKRLRESNTPDSVKKISAQAFALAEEGDIKGAIETLCKLSYVGPATASAIMAPLYSKHVAFMSDELMAIAPSVSPDSYTMQSLTNLLSDVQDRKQRAPVQKWSYADVEKAVWVATVRL